MFETSLKHTCQLQNDIKMINFTVPLHCNVTVTSICLETTRQQRVSKLKGDARREFGRILEIVQRDLDTLVNKTTNFQLEDVFSNVWNPTMIAHATSTILSEHYNPRRDEEIRHTNGPCYPSTFLGEAGLVSSRRCKESLGHVTCPASLQESFSC